MSFPKQTDPVRQLFGSDADRYDSRYYSTRYRTSIGDRQRLVTRIFRSLAIPAGARVLDVACGPGHFLEVAVQAGAIAVGLDSSRDMLRTAGKRIGRDARLVVGDGQALPFATGSFQAINCAGLIEYLPDPMPLLREFRRVLVSGGRAMVSSTNSRSTAQVLAPVIGALRRSSLVRGLVRVLHLPFDEVSLRERRFRLTYHTPRHLTALLRNAGFESVEMHYCHLQLFPHPLNHVMPAVTTACVTVTDPLLRLAPFRAFADGLLAVGSAGP